MFRLAWVDLISLRLPLSSPGFPVTCRHFIREKYLQLHCCLNWEKRIDYIILWRLYDNPDLKI